MTSILLRTAAASTGAVLLVTLSACSGGGQGSGGSSSDDLPKGPLDEMFEEMYGSEDNEQMDQQMVEVEELTAACMAEQGFEYTPVDWSQQGGMGPGEEPEEEWGTLEFAKKWGYGATTNPYGDPTENTGEESEFVDPNQAVVEAMSETEQAAYYEALYGPPVEGEGEEMTEYNWETAGCSGKAQHEVYEVGTGMDEESFTALQEEMDTMWQSIQDDPRIAEVHGEWASCMADAGYDGFAAPTDAENSIFDKTNAIYEEAYAEENFDENATEEDWAAVEAGIQDQLAAITEEEIETAVADYTCRDEVDLTRTTAEVGVEYQQDFYDAHEAELEAWREALAAQG
ncbi:hypothetical protein ICW40_04165 [Actinotalea ferrariae]|uniref:hypothetical protein n=1 Tax=Actinotalea ferrariae TaxID=1386098 RepID=UPI001C8C8D8E|nr:hypothetical protein [Actinotalea ferrariae]MBX9244002.1 hypothetical protein [Actinotalea ferrariae]